MIQKHPVLATLSAIVLLVLVGWGAWAVSVAVSPVKGAGDAVKMREDAANRTAAQERFEELYAGVQSADEKTELAAAQLKNNPKDLTLQQTFSGVQSNCVTLANQYNAESRKFLAKDFKSFDLPLQIDRTDPAFDCK